MKRKIGARSRHTCVNIERSIRTRCIWRRIWQRVWRSISGVNLSITCITTTVQRVFTRVRRHGRIGPGKRTGVSPRSDARVTWGRPSRPVVSLWGQRMRVEHARNKRGADAHQAEFAVKKHDSALRNHTHRSCRCAEPSFPTRATTLPCATLAQPDTKVALKQKARSSQSRLSIHTNQRPSPNPQGGRALGSLRMTVCRRPRSDHVVLCLL